MEFMTEGEILEAVSNLSNLSKFLIVNGIVQTTLIASILWRGVDSIVTKLMNIEGIVQHYLERQDRRDRQEKKRL